DCCHQKPPATHITTPSLHDALPISSVVVALGKVCPVADGITSATIYVPGSKFSKWKKPSTPVSGFCAVILYGSVACHTPSWLPRSEEHTSELQSRVDLVCRLVLAKK